MALELGRPQRKDVMMRLGLFTVPMTVYGTTVVDKDSQLHTACNNGHEPTRVRQHMECPACQARAGFGRGKEVDGQLEMVDEVTLAKANSADLIYKDEMELTIHPEEQVSAVLVPSGKSYWLGTNERASAPYVALARLVEARTDLAFMVRWTVRTAAATYWLKATGEGTLQLVQMADPALVRKQPVVTADHIDARHMQLIEQLADLMITDFEPVTGRGKSNVLADFFRERSHELSLSALAEPAPAGDGLSELQAALAAAVAKAGPRPVPKSKRSKGKKAA